ncbi:MAG: hypothetical protein A2660_00140 [Candidatus Doudnabacteria bacterium RIFCSPHIGHO2_01_FULL_45_18]|uniref:Response regulatory domain-containing protein n=1 Tax=Candidatus Doudnabacteria bacterium RIFCSPHIGHO2_01_FULL_45_18 TaxID=1817823 RepID=A0A1F5NSF1_9BACT|nr:MAG: hypothetical protein A2660_00140 [Candidatus Doudnabacteria bacterium RIFCSPHIGHO2_01_FULL_45_18]
MSVVSQVSRVVVVNGNNEDFEPFEKTIPLRGYFVDYIKSTDGAFAKVKKWQPALVVLFLSFDQPEWFQVLTMLQLDPDTRKIPVLSFVDELDDVLDGWSEDSSTKKTTTKPDQAEEDAPVQRPPLRMN